MQPKLNFEFWIIDLIEGTLITKSCDFEIPTKDLIDKDSIRDEETNQCTQIVQPSCVFE